MNPLELPLVAAVRRNHALEHATLNVLSERYPHLHLAGRSDWGGFTIYGPTDIHDLADAALTALQRLQAGEHRLAIHPRCGTNLVVGIALVGLGSYAALSGRRKSWLRRALGMALSLGAALTLTQPLGFKLQEHVTTSLDVADLQITSVQRREAAALVMHRIATT